MLKTIEVYLVTGFLGSGKTACLNHIIKNAPTNVKTMVLMNEFGATGIDGVLLETADLNIVEINKGSIFCACAKTDFIRALAEIASKFKPDVLIIEATGVANPSDIRRDLQLPFLKGAFNFQKQICLVDLSNFVQEFETFGSPGYQIKAADLCLLNKSDLSDADQVAAVKDLILQHNSNVVFQQTVLGQFDVAGLFPENAGKTTAGVPGVKPVTNSELETVMRAMQCDLNASLTPPDTLASAVFLWQGGSVDDFMTLVEKWPRELVRVKALLKFINGAKVRFDWVLGQLTFDKCEQNNNLHANYENLWNKIVLLAEPDVLQAFDNMALTEAGLTKMAE